jgi:hypothetical protein
LFPFLERFNFDSKTIPATLNKNLRKFLILLAIAGLVYLVMLVPLFFIYPKNYIANRINFNIEYFDSLASNLDGDCYRMAREFIKECPFPARRVHLNSEHTIVEIWMNGKWYAYDPLYKIFFNRQSAVQISFDITRGYVPQYLEDYPYVNAFKKLRYYHNWYFIILNYTHPFYDKILRLYYGVAV